MKGNYLVCTRCNGYYELEEGESPDDFESCQCGGELVLVHDIHEYFGNYEYSHKNRGYSSNKGKFRVNKVTLFLVSIIVIIPLVLYYNTSLLNAIGSDTSLMQDHSVIGSDSRGFVIKDVYGGSDSKSFKTIAIVTGIHPRETLSKNVTSNLISNYALGSDKKIVHYNIKVTNNPDDFTVGRNNGEGIAADYILPDILKSKTDLVIICHDHNPGYGQGFYIATPEMDAKSVNMAELVNKSIPGFRYYKSNTTKKSSASAVKFSKPLASGGYKTFVYEIPEWISYNEAYAMTKTFIDTCFYNI